jgi:SH3-like domain-containing protein
MNRATITMAVSAALSMSIWTQDAPGPKTISNDMPFIGEVSTSRLNVRIQPKVDPASTVVAVLSQGDQVTVIDEKDGFYGIASPRDAWTWVHSRNLQTEGDGVATVQNEAHVRSDSRVNAPAVGTLPSGTKVRIVREYLGWCKIDAGEALKFWTSKKHIKPLKKQEPTPEVKPPAAAEPAPAAPQPSGDAEAQEKIKQAEEMIASQNEALSKGEVERVDFESIAALFDEAAGLAKEPATRQYAQSNARIYRRTQNLLVAMKAPLQKMDEQKKQLDEMMEKMEKARTAVKTFSFRGYVDTTGAFMLHRPGTHKLVSEDKRIVCFLRIPDDQPKMLDRLNDHYQKFVGVNGAIIQNPPGWAGYNVVVLDEIQAITPEEGGMFLLGETR